MKQLSKQQINLFIKKAKSSKRKKMLIHFVKFLERNRIKYNGNIKELSFEEMTMFIRCYKAQNYEQVDRVYHSNEYMYSLYCTIKELLTDIRETKGISRFRKEVEFKKSSNKHDNYVRVFIEYHDLSFYDTLTVTEQKAAHNSAIEKIIKIILEIKQKKYK